MSTHVRFFILLAAFSLNVVSALAQQGSAVAHESPESIRLNVHVAPKMAGDAELQAKTLLFSITMLLSQSFRLRPSLQIKSLSRLLC